MTEFNMKPNDNFKLPIQNSYFILSDKNAYTPVSKGHTDYSTVTNFDPVYNNDLSKYIMYATSNIVKQFGSRTTAANLTSTQSRGGY